MKRERMRNHMKGGENAQILQGENPYERVEMNEE